MKNQNKIIKIAILLVLMFGITPAANAMHIMEGYLPAKYCIGWGIICLPFLIGGFFLGGTIGIGTVLSLISIGPFIQLCLPVGEKIVNFIVDGKSEQLEEVTA